jgi:riboflavin kinase / FMN adenylyltransferase
METLRTFEELGRRYPKPCVAIGVFDGVHVGHQAVIRQARDEARVRGGTSVVLTFDPHPQRILQPDKAPPLLTATAHKLRLIAQLGVDACLVLKFDQAFAGLAPEEFLDQLCRQADRLQVICVGTRFHFGHNRAGNIRLIERLAPRYGYTAREIEPVRIGEHLVSSTVVRQQVLRGHLDLAATLLGRPYSVLGTVQPGDHLGRQLGFPTANLNPHQEALPPNGVYVVHARLGEQHLPAVVNLGTRPTVTGGTHRRTLEVHLLDFDRDLYGQDLEVIFVAKLRDEQKFASLEALKHQISVDIAAARQRLNL